MTKMDKIKIGFSIAQAGGALMMLIGMIGEAIVKNK